MLTVCFDLVLGAFSLLDLFPSSMLRLLSNDIGGAAWRSSVDQAGDGVWSVTD